MSLKLKTHKIEAATQRVRMVELVSAEGGALPAFTAGAHIDLELGHGEVRSYSLLNNPGESHRYVIGVLREEPGKGGSAWVHDQLKQGDILESSEPVNQFPINEAGGRHILIAGGIGVTPLIAMAHRLNTMGAEYQFHYSARTTDEAAFIGDITTLAGDKLKLHLDGGDPAKGLDVKALLGNRPSAAHVYVCGPAGLIRTVRETTKDWPKGTVHYELFHGDEAAVAPRSTDTAFDVVLNKTGRTIHIPADKKILDILKDEGFKIKVLCTEGVCGTCKVKLISGKADHRDDVLTKREQEKFIQVCVSRAMPGETLVLDL